MYIDVCYHADTHGDTFTSLCIKLQLHCLCIKLQLQLSR